MQILTILGKGGAGKTTAVVNLATVAAGLNMSVGILDFDPQASAHQWSASRQKDDIKVRLCRQGRLEALIQSGRNAHLDWLLIDTPPQPADAALAAVRVADVVLVATRPANFDLRVTRQRVELLRSAGCQSGVIINAAPPRREGLDAPFVREARSALMSGGAWVWGGQITQRHSIVSSLIDGRGVVETEPDGPAAHEFSRLWAATLKHVARRRIAA